MATKKKAKKKSTTSGKSASKKSKSAPKKLTQKRKTPKKSAKRVAAPKKAAAKKKLVKKAASPKVVSAPNKKIGTRKQEQQPFGFERGTSRSGEEAGDLQGLSNVESADSESVDELVEEGSAFEAGVISGVEEAGDQDEREVRTHEVPEDDVPGEYLDED
ncbi:MAG TPA: hypothetical protein VK828_17255 [Terriglobales bacterium]|jgi:hypothetical protein|nr:hypothetical protein [Terriglobales bacterium]